MAAIVLAAPMAFAQEIHPDCPEDPGDEEQAQAAAGEWFAKGEKLVKKQKYNKALGAFMCAYALAPHPAPIFNAGQAAASAGDDQTALKMLRQYLQIAPDGPQAGLARQQVAELEAKLGVAPLPPPPAAGSAQPQPPPPQEQPEQELPWEQPEPEPEEPADEGAGPLTITGAVLVGVGAAGAAVGGVLQGLAGKAVKDGEATDDYGFFTEQEDKVDGYQKGALVCFIAGGALIATGIVLIVADSKDEEPATEVSLAPAPGGVLVQGTF
jgi:hypothetical protein